MKRRFELEGINDPLERLGKRVDALLEYFTTLFLLITGEPLMHTKEIIIPTVNKEVVTSPAIAEETSEQKIIRLENQVNRLEQLLNMALTKIEAQAVEITELKLTVRNQQAQIDRQSITIKEKNNVIANLTQKLNEVMEENRQLKEENKAFREKEDEAEIMRTLEELVTPRDDVSIPTLVINTTDKISEDEIATHPRSKSVPVTRTDLVTNLWNPLSGVLDTLFYEMPCRHHKKNQEEVKWLAREGNADALEKTIKSKVVDVNGRGMPDSLCAIVKGFFEKTALMLAAEKGNLKCVSVLLKSGAHVNLLDRDGCTALDHAIKNGHGDVEYMLRLHNGLSGNQIGSGMPIPAPIVSVDPVSTPQLTR